MRQFTTPPSVWAKNERAVAGEGRPAVSVRTPRAQGPLGGTASTRSYVRGKKARVFTPVKRTLTI